MHLSALLVFTGLGLLAVEAAPRPRSTPQDHVFSSGSEDRPKTALPRKRVPVSHVLHERHEPAHAEGWEIVERANPTASLPMRLGLKQSNLDSGHELLMDLSHPESPNYGKHMTAQEVIDLFAPANETVDAVRQWLVSAGVQAERIAQSTNKQWIAFDVSVEKAEQLLHTSYHVYEHTETGIRNIACQEYHLPRAIQPLVDYITPGIKLMTSGYSDKQLAVAAARKKKRRQSKRQSEAFEADHIHKPHPASNSPDRANTPEELLQLLSPGPCTNAVTPKCVRYQYHIPPGTSSTPGNELGIFQSLSQHYNQADLDTYFSTVTPYVPNGTHPLLHSINGAEGPTTNQDAAGEEADLDFQVAIPLIHPQSTILFQTDDEWYQLDQQLSTTQYAGFFNTFFDALDGSYCSFSAFGETGNCIRDGCRDPEYPNQHADSGYQGQLMCGVYAPTNVISISYSGVEAALPYSYMRRQCAEMMKLGLQGVTVVESSGDHGVGGRRWDDRSGCLGPEKDIFSPRTMSNCPYVLSVGATTLVDNPGGGRCRAYKEVAPKTFASGGGFSNVFPRPEWQRGAVEGYLNKTNMSQLGYVTAFAGAGDVAARPGGGLNSSSRVVIGGDAVEPGKLFNKAGRGYPDVAAIGEKYLVYIQGYPDYLAGTSVAVPIWASMLTLINEERLKAGKRPVGFVHPVLYDHPEVFTDIIEGSNPGCGSKGFQVKEGWDPVTGLGSPKYPKLLRLFMSLP